MKNTKPVIFISDLHIGAGRTNDFFSTYQLHRLLDYAAGSASELVLLGDFLELIQDELATIYLQHHPVFVHLFRLARQIPVRYVVGNHDALVTVDYDPAGPSYFFGSPVQVLPEYENPSLRLFAIHGHQFDEYNRTEDLLNPSFGYSPGDHIARAVGFLESHVNRRTDDFLDRMYLNYKKLLRQVSHDAKKYSQLVTPANPEYEKLGGDYQEYERGAADVLQSDRYTLCLLGHTHRAMVKRFGQKIYLNTGSWTGNDFVKDPPTFAEVSTDFVRLIDAETFEVLHCEERHTKKHSMVLGGHRQARTSAKKIARAR